MTSPDKPQHYSANGGDSTGGAVWHSPQHHPNPASSPLPPGFVGGVPPPGFQSDSSRERSPLPPEMNSNTDTARAAGGNKKSLHQGTLSAELAQASGGRSSSYVNLEAVFGKGLAESMDDATKADEQNQQQHQEAQDLSFTRQNRHAMARLIGASPPRVDAFGLDLGSNGLIGGVGQQQQQPPANLGGILNRDLQQQQQQQHADHHGAIVQGGNFLPGTFNSNANSNSNEGFLLRREDSPLSMFGPSSNRRGQLPVSKDLGVTVMEPGNMNEQRIARDMSVAQGRGDYGSEDGGGVLAALMQEQQQGYCNDPQCPQQLHPSYEQKMSGHDVDTFEAERRMQNLWLDEDAASLGQGSRQSSTRNQQKLQQQHNPFDRSSVINQADSRSAGSQSSRKVAEAELRPFLWDTRVPQYQSHQQYRGGQQQPQGGTVEPSRCLAIMRAAGLQIPEVRSTCEAFGVIDTFRSDFVDRGIIFVSYYDIRCAQYAALDLEAVLKRRENDRGGNAQDICVYYCVPLDSSSQSDESRLVLSDVPPYVDEHVLVSMLSSYGSVRSLKRHGGYYGGSSFEAEFHNVQDAKQALLELTSTQPWGADVAVEVAMRQPIDRKRGRELLSVIGRWRHGPKVSISPSTSARGRFEAPPSQLNHGAVIYRGAESSTSSSPAVAAPAETTQLVLGPDGRYSYVIVNNQSGYPQPVANDYHSPYGRGQQQEQTEPQRQQIVHGPNGEIYITTVAVPAAPRQNYRQPGPPPSREYYPPPSQKAQSVGFSSQSHYSTSSYHSGDSRERLDRVSGPYYPHHPQQVMSAHPEHHHGGPHHHPHHPHSSNASSASAGGEDKDNRHLVLDLDAVENARDSRTSLMVRNIPNKYTQQMLLAEFTENGLGPGVIDFFYLPIDFKNRCNRGYAFINFVDFKDILPFHRRYFGKHWSTFNSDKICDITYARIQGKAAMLKRFENSALMEKDEEYKPLVFISHGPEKGNRIPFPEAAAASHKS